MADKVDTKAAPPKGDTKGTFREYEELDGAQGREVHFRPQRLARADLSPMHVSATLWVGDEKYEVDLTNVSQNGASLSVPTNLPLDEGDTAKLDLHTDGHEAYVGAIRVQWSRPEGNHTLLGVAFSEALLDLEEVLQLRDLQTLRRSGERSSQKAWRIVKHDRFKSGVAEFALLLQDLQKSLGEMERTLSPYVLYTERESAPRAALETAIGEDVVPGVLHYAEELDSALRLATTSERPGLEEFGHRYLQEFLMQAPWMHRAHHKPLGYPGDYEVMNFVYARELVGPTLFAKALHRAFLDVPGAQAVRERKNLIKRELRTTLASHEKAGKSVRILSVAAGPAEELYELLSEIETCPPTEIVLFDQDPGALQHAHRRLSSVVTARWQDRVKVRYLHDSIKRLLVDPEIFRERGTFDVILCAGFFDYLRTLSAARTTKTFYRYLNPGGAAYIGNMVPSNPSRWLMELHLDWYLIYRSHEEMIAFAQNGAPEADIRILEEATKINPFLCVRRPG